jgi:hypothetical protein
MVRITEIDDLLFPVELRPVHTSIIINGKESSIEVPNSKLALPYFKWLYSVPCKGLR